MRRAGGWSSGLSGSRARRKAWRPWSASADGCSTPCGTWRRPTPSWRRSGSQPPVLALLTEEVHILSWQSFLEKCASRTCILPQTCSHICRRKRRQATRTGFWGTLSRLGAALTRARSWDLRPAAVCSLIRCKCIEKSCCRASAGLGECTLGRGMTDLHAVPTRNSPPSLEQAWTVSDF